jgi:hypothetical protein
MKNTCRCLLIALFPLSLNAQFNNPIKITPHLNGITYIQAANINGDEYLDLVGVTDDNDRIYWVPFSATEQEYQEPILVKTAIVNPGPMLAQDINGDGIDDIILTDLTDGSLWWLATLDGGNDFAAPQVIDSGSGGVSVLQSGDLNNDGWQDLIIFRQNSSTLGWYANQGDGSWTDFQLISDSTPNISKILINDFNQDGRQDLLASNGGNVMWFPNQSDEGTFESLQLLVTNSPIVISNFDVGDIDGDVDKDLVYVSRTNGGVYALYRLNGEEEFSAPVQIQEIIISSNISLQRLLLHDIDSDNDLDIVTEDGSASGIGYLRNTQGNFGDLEGLITIRSATDFILVDIDGDDDLDGISISKHLNSCYWLEKTGPQANDFVKHRIYHYGYGNARNIHAVDLDGDNALDLVNIGIGGMFAHHNINGYAAFAPSTFINETSSSIFRISSGDFNEDGLVDLIMTTYYGIFYLQKLTEGSGYADPIQVSPEANDDPTALLPIDINGDDHLDIIYASQGNIYIATNDGAANFSTVLGVPSSLMQTKAHFQLADLDQDGDLDLAIVYSSSVGGLVWSENTDGLGDFSEPITIAEGVKAIEMEVNDINLDFFPDIVIKQGGDAMVYLNEAGNTFASPTLLTEAKLLKFGDIDLDGTEDLVVIWNSKVYWQRNLEGSFSERIEVSAISGNYDELMLTDIDQDGDIDIFCGHLADEFLWFENSTIDNNPFLKVRTFWDQNANGIFEPGEFPLYHQAVSIDPNPIRFWTDQDGLINARVYPDDYQLTISNAEQWDLTTPATYDLSLDEGSPLTCWEFGLIPNTELLQGELTLASGPTRCGFDVPFWLDFRNQGTIVANGTASITLDPLVTFIAAEPMPDSTHGLQLFWFQDNLIPTAPNRIRIDLRMPGPEYIGENITFSASLDLQAPQQELGSITNTEYIAEINCAYDPNDKLVEPNHLGEENYTLFSDTLRYTIRFQNTGTDTAFNVRITDRLATRLDHSTFKMTATSHDVEVMLDEYGLVTFFFPDILLPDSTTNAAGSHGFVKFEVLPLTDLPENILVTNKAEIYFDFNPAIVTNQTRNRLVSSLPFTAYITSPSCAQTSDGSIEVVFPVDSLQYQWSNGTTESFIENIPSGDYNLTVSDQYGNVVQATTITVTAPAPLISIPEIAPETDNEQNGSIVPLISGGTPPYTYDWSTGAISPILSELSAGTYMLTVTDAAGCTLEQIYLVDQLVNSEDMKQSTALEVYPNPSNGLIDIHLSVDIHSLWQLQIVNASGIIQQTITNKLHTIATSLIRPHKLPPGIYFIYLKVEKRILVKKFIVLN